jgi:ABC-type phosphate transport system permease subunit
MTITGRILDLASILLAALVAGVFWGPWLAVSRSMNSFSPTVFLALVQRMDRNLGSVMGVLMPVALASMIAVLVNSYRSRPETFSPTLFGFALFLMTLLVTAWRYRSSRRSVPGQWRRCRRTGSGFATDGSPSTSCAWSEA